MRNVIQVGLVLLLALLSNKLDAKCIERRYQISGVVRDTAGEPIEGVEVAASWPVFESVARQTAVSGTDGRYHLVVVFNGFSGAASDGSDRCDSKLGRIRVVAKKAGFVGDLLEVVLADEIVADFVLKTSTGDD